MIDRIVVRQDYSSFAQWFGKRLLHLLGWEVLGNRPAENKCVLPCAPHTSNWDLFYTLLAAMALRVPMVFMMKDTMFFWPLGSFWRWLGGVPVDRSRNANIVEQMAQVFRDNEVFYLIITPEGTRKSVDYWKTGFYWIAVKAGVPLLPGIIKYDKKQVGVGPVIYLSGDLERDFEGIRAYYAREVGVEARLKPRQVETVPPAA